MPRRKGTEAGHNGAAHAALGRVEDCDVGGAERFFEQGCRVVAGTGVNPDEGVRRPGLSCQRREGPGEKVTAVVGYHDGGDSYFLKN
jgi:hypothetical protein